MPPLGTNPPRQAERAASAHPKERPLANFVLEMIQFEARRFCGPWFRTLVGALARRPRRRPLPGRSCQILWIHRAMGWRRVSAADDP